MHRLISQALIACAMLSTSATAEEAKSGLVFCLSKEALERTELKQRYVLAPATAKDDLERLFPDVQFSVAPMAAPDWVNCLSGKNGPLCDALVRYDDNIIQQGDFAIGDYLKVGFERIQGLQDTLHSCEVIEEQKVCPTKIGFAFVPCSRCDELKICK